MGQSYLLNGPNQGSLTNTPGHGGASFSVDNPGKIVYVMGRSGVGKDSLIAAAREVLPPGAVIIRRYVTEVRGGGDDLYIKPEEFARQAMNKAWALHWSAHGLKYGISTLLDEQLLSGLIVVVNGSRGYLKEAVRLYPDLVPVLVTTAPEVLKERLEKRGREGIESIDERLKRTDLTFDLSGQNIVTIDNSGLLKTAVWQFTEILRRQILLKTKDNFG
jgi:ribose 1,5-bisphosphokinase